MDVRRRLGVGLLDVVPVSASFTLGPQNNEQLIQSTSATDITITLPNNLPVGFSCLIEQGGAGAVIVAAAAGGSLVSEQGYDRTGGQYSLCSLFVRANATGITASYNFSGNGA